MNSVFQKLKIQKTLLWSVKFLVFVFVLYHLVTRLLTISSNDLTSIAIAKPSYVVVAVFLVVVNWGLEWLKWSITVYRIGYAASKGKLFKSMIAGVSTGIITPNRIGNFIGRMLYFKPKQRALLVLGTLYGNLSQFVATLLFGLLGLFFSTNGLIQFDYSNVWVILTILVATLSFLLYFLYPVLPIEGLSFFRRKTNLIQLFRSSAKKMVFSLLFLSSMRYLIFILQFTLLLIGFGAEYSHEMIYSLYILYLASTLTPNLILGKLVVRETLALIILGGLILNPLVIIAASFTLWMINLGIPALVGLFFFLKSKKLEG